MESMSDHCNSGSPLRQLAERIAEARAKMLLPSLEALAEWHELTVAAVHRYGEEWMSEPQFRQYSGKGREWCRSNFEGYVELGRARLVGKRRHWAKQAAPPQRKDNDDVERIQREIISSFR